MRTTTGNKRLDEAIRKELKVNRGGQIWLDCFMGRTSHTEIAPTITTRTSSDNNNFIMERNMNEDKKTKVAMTLDGTYEHSNRVYDVDALAPTMQTCGGGNREPKILTRPHGYYKGEVKEKVAPAVKASAYAENKYLQEPICLNSKVNGKQPSVQDRIYSPEGTSTAITTCFHVNIQEPINAMPKDFRIRKLTPRECFRLMDVDDKDIDTIQAAGISDSQQYKLAGNSIVVNVLTEIFRKMLVDTQNDDRQLRMF